MFDYDRPIKDTIYEAIAKTLNVDVSTLTDETNLVADLKAKSTNFVHIVSAIEKTYNLTVPFMQLRRQKTIGDMIEFVTELSEE